MEESDPSLPPLPNTHLWASSARHTLLTPGFCVVPLVPSFLRAVAITTCVTLQLVLTSSSRVQSPVTLRPPKSRSRDFLCKSCFASLRVPTKFSSHRFGRPYWAAHCFIKRSCLFSPPSNPCWIIRCDDLLVFVTQSVKWIVCLSVELHITGIPAAHCHVSVKTRFNQSLALSSQWSSGQQRGNQTHPRLKWHLSGSQVSRCPWIDPVTSPQSLSSDLCVCLFLFLFF